MRNLRFIRRELTVDLIDEDTGERLGWWFAGEEEKLEELIARFMAQAGPLVQGA